jgi:hypothetical protein
LVAVVAALAVGALARKRSETALRLRAGSETVRRPERGEWWVVAGAGVVLSFLLTPIVALVVKSVSTPDGWSLAGYRALGRHGAQETLQISGWDSALNSLRTATDATTLAMVIGVLAAVVRVALRRTPGRIQVDSKEDAMRWVKRIPMTPEVETEIEVRRVSEAEDFGEAFTPELREAEERLPLRRHRSRRRRRVVSTDGKKRTAGAHHRFASAVAGDEPGVGQ